MRSCLYLTSHVYGLPRMKYSDRAGSQIVEIDGIDMMIFVHHEQAERLQQAVTAFNDALDYGAPLPVDAE